MTKNKLTPQSFFKYLDDGVSFSSGKAASIRTIYAPLCGKDESSLKSCITPFLSGDMKIDRSNYVTKPTSTEDLRFPLRNFHCYFPNKTVLSLAEKDRCTDSRVEAGQLWHKLICRYSNGLVIEALNFIPVDNDKMELMVVTCKNTSRKTFRFTPTASIPLFARSLQNKHDHEHVTSLLNRIEQVKEGVLVFPTMKFNEEGHKPNSQVFFVFGATDKKYNPSGTFPTVNSFYGYSGNVFCPQSIYENERPRLLAEDELQGKEAIGALRFDDVSLRSGAQKTFIIAVGTDTSKKNALNAFKRLDSLTKTDEALEKTKTFWKEKIETISFKTGDNHFNAWMRWVTLQPVLRRIYGCSFLPDHDYGKGGKGWRDIWQDLLSLILIEPEQIRSHLINNFAGVRIDGSNATIIGSRPGEFVADRNSITRVWMDHGVWPFMTILLYIHQTGDFDILLEKNTYFRDPQLSRTFVKDSSWTPHYGNKLKTKTGGIYEGTLIEHILVENLVPFFNVGEHNCYRLESADWNDGLDMAFARGESVAFMGAYAGNLFDIADLLEIFSKNKFVSNLTVAKELAILFDSLSTESCDYDSVEAKKTLLFDEYFPSVESEVSGEKIDIPISRIVYDLRRKGQWVFDLVRRQEIVKAEYKGKKLRWFNGYYDNAAERVEGKKGDKVWMTLTGQVFSLMSGLAESNEAKDVIQSVELLLKDKKLKGYRLNTDFGLRHYLDLGRAFGFAYGTKENGAFFSHMIVMYAYALYKRGFVREGYGVLKSIYDMCMDAEKSRIYPGIPEYFDSEGKGMYHYLTGSASWFVLTELTQVFGVRGYYGDLLIEHKLVKEQFSGDGKAEISINFQGKRIHLIFENTGKLDFGAYVIQKISYDKKSLEIRNLGRSQVILPQSILKNLPSKSSLKVVLQAG